MNPSAQPSLVVVDDSDDDIYFFKRLLEKAEINSTLLPLYDGREAIKFFGQVASGGIAAPLACFIDIRMPGFNGFDVLDAIRSSEELDPISAIMLSNSDDRRDIVRSADKGAQCYLVKYPNVAAVRAVVEGAKAFWPRTQPTTLKPFGLSENLLPR